MVYWSQNRHTKNYKNRKKGIGGKKKKNRRIGRPVVSPLIESEKEEAAYMLRHKTWVFGNIK